MKQIKTVLTFDRSTKGTHVFKDDADNAPIKSVYIQRTGIEGNPPAKITITVEESK